MTSFADQYTVAASPTDATATSVASVDGLQIYDVGAPIHLHAWVALDLDATATAITLDIRRGFADLSSVKSVTYDTTKLVGTANADGFALECVDGPGMLGDAPYQLWVTVTGATGPSSVVGVHLGARYDSNRVAAPSIA